MITVTTINNASAAAKTFTLMYQRPDGQFWYNASDEAASFHMELSTFNRLTGKTPGNQTRRCGFNVNMTKIDSTTPTQEVGSIQLSVIRPQRLALLTPANFDDLVTFLTNVATTSNMGKLFDGQI
jgi:hypothetical protein